MNGWKVRYLDIQMRKTMRTSSEHSEVRWQKIFLGYSMHYLLAAVKNGWRNNFLERTLRRLGQNESPRSSSCFFVFFVFFVLRLSGSRFRLTRRSREQFR